MAGSVRETLQVGRGYSQGLQPEIQRTFAHLSWGYEQPLTGVRRFGKDGKRHLCRIKGMCYLYLFFSFYPTSPLSERGYKS